MIQRNPENDDVAESAKEIKSVYCRLNLREVLGKSRCVHQ